MWILDTLGEMGKLSPVQVAILFYYAKMKGEPRKITELIENFEKNFRGYWHPKKGTIYPSVHNLDVRGYLKLHATKPYGYSITEKGMKAINQMISNMELQLAVHIKYYEFIIDGILAINEIEAKELLKKQIIMLKEFITLIETK